MLITGYGAHLAHGCSPSLPAGPAGLSLWRAPTSWKEALCGQRPGPSTLPGYICSSLGNVTGHLQILEYEHFWHMVTRRETCHPLWNICTTRLIFCFRGKWLPGRYRRRSSSPRPHSQFAPEAYGRSSDSISTCSFRSQFIRAMKACPAKQAPIFSSFQP